MATFQMIPVSALIEPETPQRQESLYERIDELRDSIRTNGLQQPIGVEALPGNHYRIIWGHRRSIAVTQLQWEYIPAMVYEQGEADVDVLMGSENYHRNEVNYKEEALFYRRVFPRYPEGTIGMAREFNVSQKRIEDLLALADGDPLIFDKLVPGGLSLAQAKEISKFESPGYRLQAIERCLKAGASADVIRLWRREIQIQGMDRSSAEQQVSWNTPQPVQGNIPMAHCQIGNHEVILTLRKVYEICNEHYNVMLEGLEARGREIVLQEAGLWHHVIRLLKVAEGQEGNDDGTLRSGSTGGS